MNNRTVVNDTTQAVKGAVVNRIGGTDSAVNVTVVANNMTALAGINFEPLNASFLFEDCSDGYPGLPLNLSIIQVRGQLLRVHQQFFKVDRMKISNCHEGMVT